MIYHNITFIGGGGEGYVVIIPACLLQCYFILSFNDMGIKLYLILSVSGSNFFVNSLLLVTTLHSPIFILQMSILLFSCAVIF